MKACPELIEHSERARAKNKRKFSAARWVFVANTPKNYLTIFKLYSATEGLQSNDSPVGVGDSGKLWVPTLWVIAQPLTFEWVPILKVTAQLLTFGWVPPMDD